MTMSLFVVLLALLFALDAASTHYILARGGTELNPAIRKLISLTGSAGAALLAVKFVAFVIIVANLALIASEWRIGLVIFYALVVAWNILQAVKSRASRS